MTIKNKYTHGDTVYLVTDPEQHVRMVSLLTVYPNGLIKYLISYNGEDYECWDFELSGEIDEVKKVSN